MGGPRYTEEEDTALVTFILANQGAYGSFGIFVDAAREAVETRTPHSLYQRFHKYLTNELQEKPNAARLTENERTYFVRRYNVNVANVVGENGGKVEDGIFDVIFACIACLIGCLDSDDEDYDKLDKQFTSFIDMYWHKETPRTRTLTQRHLEIIVQAFFNNFNASIEEGERIVSFNDDILRQLRTVYSSLTNPVIKEQELFNAIDSASKGKHVGWPDVMTRVNDKFDFPSKNIKCIIIAIYKALDPGYYLFDLPFVVHYVVTFLFKFLI
ncbi:hypothetical protein CAEBREN_17976 [Caenorhabditis brenneri]|uniref:Myb-like domain-containing protein n=1 Tax=Caenorhabditis brenneri TaxID=135651 RepID=G0MV00_CAEBE|nr:hypothetical protein CAEBREN_17976 [Caenorhabditis brenneri]